jgi:hypothetical protein
MRLSECKLGLLLNFYTKSLKNGIKRLILWDTLRNFVLNFVLLCDAKKSYTEFHNGSTK